MGCGNNTLAMSMPKDGHCSSAQCTSSCSSGLSHTDPLDKSELGSRFNRYKVKEQIRDYILHMLGVPVLDLELDEQNIDFCIDQALKIVEDYAPSDFFDYYVFSTTPGKSIYKLPAEIGVVRQVYYRETGTYGFSAQDLDGAIPIEYFYPSGMYSSIFGGIIDPAQPIYGRAGEWTLYKSYENLFSKTSSSLGGWEWISDYNHIKLYPVPARSYRVIVHYLQKNKDWKQVNQSMQEGALSYAKEILGRIRSKYLNPPGPGGGLQLDGNSLLQEAFEERRQWKEDLITRWGEVLPITFG